MGWADDGVALPLLLWRTVERGAVWIRRNVYLDLFFIGDGVDEGFAVLLECAATGPRPLIVLGLRERGCGVRGTEERLTSFMGRLWTGLRKISRMAEE